MKKLIYISMVLLLMVGCTSSKTFLERGNYSMAVNKAVKHLQKKPDKEKEIAVLKLAFSQAQQQNLDRIAYLRKTGQPDIWAEVFSNYNQLKNRQNLVKTLNPVVLVAIGFEMVNYDDAIIEAQKKASEYFYVHGKSLLAKNEKMAARDAYEDFINVKNYYANYKDVDDLLQKAKALGTSHVLFMMQNNSYTALPKDFENEFMFVSLDDMNSKWVLFDTQEQEDVVYDYAIVLNLKVIDVSPERLKEKNWVESKEVQDGFIYKLDNHGNVMKDSAGNDIKTSKYIRISCDVAEIAQNKEAVLSGRVDFYNNITKQLLQSEPITANSVFNNMYLVTHGDLQALNHETQRRLGNGPMPFPNDFDMIMMAKEYLQHALTDVIRRKKNLLQ